MQSGTVSVGGNAHDVYIRGDFAGQVNIGGTLNGQIRVYRRLYDDPNAAAEIQVGAMDPNHAAIATDWDGYDSWGGWQPGAVIQVGQTIYTGNTPAARIYAITCQKGDMNNDGAVNFADINPFVSAISGSGEAFDAAYPGLAGSRGYHANCNCDYDANGDDLFNFADINPFIMRLSDPNAYYVNFPCCEQCVTCRREEMTPLRSAAVVPSIPPQELAEQLATYVAPDLYGSLVTIVGQTAAWHESRAVRAYWRAVHEILAP